jgi:predicted nucleic acid-binding protein
MLVYCDSVVLIYFFEQVGQLQAAIAHRLLASQNAGDLFAVSDLTRLECRVRPIKNGDSGLLAGYDAFFNGSDVVVVPLTRAVYDRATEIRARYPFKTADSLHLAAAVESGCGLFLTNDLKLSRFTDVPVEVL